MTGLSDEMVEAAVGVLRAANPWNNLSGGSVAAALEAALDAAPTAPVDDGGRYVWACDCNVDPDDRWHVALRSWCEEHDCPGPHHRLLVGPTIRDDR